MQELKTATNDEMKMTIHVRWKLEEVEGDIQEWKVEVNKWESLVNEHEGRLGLPKKEGELRL